MAGLFLLIARYVFSISAVTICYCAYPEKIPGPKRKNCSIAIVGGDFTGIYMALLLRQKGYTDIVVYEKEDRLGGKQTNPYNHRGVDHELGISSFVLGTENKLKEFVTKYFSTSNLLEKIPRPAVWLNETNFTTIQDFLLHTARTKFGNMSSTELRTKVELEVNKYQVIHRRLLGDISDRMPQELSWKNKFELGDESFNSFLKKHDIEIINPICRFLFTMLGYGVVNDEIPAINVLYCCSPVRIKAILNGSFNDTDIGFYLPKISLYILLQQMVLKEKLRIVKQARVIRVKRDNSRVILKLDHFGRRSTVEHDFIVWSPSMHESLQYFVRPATFEYQVFLRGKPRYITKTLVDSDMRRSFSPIEYYTFDNNDENILLTQVDTYAVIRGTHLYYGDSYQQNIVPTGDDQNTTIRSSVFTQLSEINNNNNVKSITESNLKDILIKMGAKTYEIVSSKSWSFSWNYDKKDTLWNGVYYRILEAQGKWNMWYIGSSVWFDSISEIMKYNEHLVANMV